MMGTAGPHSTFTFKLECITRREFPSVQYCTGAKREAQATKRNGERKAGAARITTSGERLGPVPAGTGYWPVGRCRDGNARRNALGRHLPAYDLGKVGDTQRFAVDR